MKHVLLAAALVLVSAPAFAQYGGGGQNSGGPMGSAMRSGGQSGMTMQQPSQGRTMRSNRMSSKKMMKSKRRNASRNM